MDTKPQDPTKPVLTSDQRKREFDSSLTILLDKYKFKLKPMLSFPRYAILPAEVNLALEVLRKAESGYIIELVDLLEEPKEGGSNANTK